MLHNIQQVAYNINIETRERENKKEVLGMKIKIDERFKEEVYNELQEKRRKVDEMKNKFIEGKCSDYALSGKIDFYEKEISYLEGRLTTLELIESGCFYKDIIEAGEEAEEILKIIGEGNC